MTKKSKMINGKRIDMMIAADYTSNLLGQVKFAPKSLNNLGNKTIE